MRYVSVCSGIEAATVAWHPLGWHPVAFSENDAFPSAVLAHHYPDVPNYGDLTRYQEWNLDGAVDLVVGGTPCQSFSVAGLRQGMADPRGNLALTFLGLVDRVRPRWVVWENVPGVLSSNGGRDFGAFLGALAQLGYGFAYRVLDAQFFGVAQRRRRVFVVGYLGDWRPAAAVLFESDSLCRNTPPSRKAGESVAEGAIRCFDRQSSGEYGTSPVASTVSARDFKSAADLVAQPMAFTQNTRDEVRYINGDGQITGALAAEAGMKQTNYVQQTMQVRRLMPVECERLQGFPDNYTNIPWRKKSESPDGLRYKALGNSMAVPVMRWIGQRITQVEDIVCVSA
jgi:DNA (cytosine-5)-methyltransferase 1